MAKVKGYVAYADLGKGSGAPVNPDDHGGVDSEEFKYMLEHRTVLPLGDPDVPAPPDEEEEPVPALQVPKDDTARGADGTTPEVKSDGTTTPATTPGVGSSSGSSAAKAAGAAGVKPAG